MRDLYIYLGVYLSILTYSQGRKELVYFSQAKTWVEARSICRSMNGQLMMSNALNRDIINNCPEIKSDQRFWVGEYKTLSPWFEIIGCFAKSDVQFNETYDNSFRNEVSVCHRVCNTTYIGLQDKKCYCVNEDFNGIQNSASSKCNIVCDGNSAEYCGGNDVINVYRTARYIPTEDICPFGDICLCSQMDCQLTGVAYTARPCQERMQGACGNWIVNDMTDSWSASNDRCSQQGYLTNQDNALTFCENRQFSSPESFWVGVFRSAIHNFDQNKNKDVQLNAEEEKLLYCFTLTKGVIYDSTRSDSREMDTCYNKRLPFVCEIGASAFGQASCSLYTTTSTAPSTTETTTPVLQNSTYVMGRNDKKDIVDIGIIIALATGSGLALLLVVLLICVVQKRRDNNYRRKFKTPYVINSYGKDVNIDSPQKKRRRNETLPDKQKDSPLIGRRETEKFREKQKLKGATDRVIYGTPVKKLPKLMETEIYVVSSDCDESDVAPRSRPKKGIMKKTPKSVRIEPKFGDDSGIEEAHDQRRIYDADNSSYSEDSLTRKVKIDNLKTKTKKDTPDDEKSPYRYVYSEW